MRLVTDQPAQRAAIRTVRELIDAGLAGLDCYDSERFVVEAPGDYQDAAEVALEVLGAQFFQVGPLGRRPVRLECTLPRWARAEFGLDEPDAPTLIVPLGSRGVA